MGLPGWTELSLFLQSAPHALNSVYKVLLDCLVYNQRLGQIPILALGEQWSLAVWE